MDNRGVLREFVAGLLSEKGDRAKFADDENLVTRGRFQSIDTLEVIVFLEEKFGIDFAETGFDQSQVESIDKILSLIAERA